MFTHRIRASSFIALAAALVCAIFAFAPAGTAGELPEAEKVLDRYVEAIGGVKAFDKLHSTATKASLAIPAMGVTIDITAYAARPNRFYSLAESPMIGKIERGTDGTTFWEKSTMQGARILEGEELAEALLDARFEGLTYWRSIYDSVAVSGLDTVEGKAGYKVVLKPKAGKLRTFVFDVGSGLLVKTLSTASTQMGDIPIVSYISDYRPLGDILQSYKSTMTIMGQERVITVSGIEQNAAIPDSVWALPADVKELMPPAKAEEKR